MNGVMARRENKNQAGYLLVDLAVALTAAALLALGVFVLATGAQQAGMARATIESMESALHAALVYRWENGTWPASLDVLGLPPRGRSTPWGQPFVLERATTRSITLRTRLPAGVLAQVTKAPNAMVAADGTVRMTITMNGIEVQDLEVEKKILY